MVQISTIRYISGLDLNSNYYASTPNRDYWAGTRSSCTIADECVLTRQRTIGNRRGFDYAWTTSALVDSMFEFQGYCIQHQSNSSLWRADPIGGTRTSYAATFDPPTPYRMDFTACRGSMFFSANVGIGKLDAATNQPARAGITKGLDTRSTWSGTGGGYLGAWNKVAYHITWTRTDANNQQVRGDVSERIIVTNATQQTLSSLTSAAGVATATTPVAHGFTTGDTILIAGATQTQYNGSFTITVTSGTTFTYPVSGSPASPATSLAGITCGKTMNVNVSFTVPSDVGSSDSYEVWRTVSVSADNADPGDDCYLVATTKNSGWTACQTLTYTDTTSDSVIINSTPLYTNSTQEGALQGNSRPPGATCVASYKDYLLMGNTYLDHQMTLELLTTTGLVSGQFITVGLRSSGTRTYIFGSAENVSTRTAQIFTGGLSPADNIEQTMRSLCHVINGDTSGWVYAEYISGINDNPGIIRLWQRQPWISLNGFYVTASNSTTGNLFSPALPTSGQTVVSSNDARQNRLFYSKLQQPDHVPIVNFIDVGRLDQPIVRIIPVRDAAYIIKTDGVWYLSGLVAPFSLVELDTTCHIIAPATAVQLNNAIYMLSNQGVVRVSASGVTVISFDIEPAIMDQTIRWSNISAVAHGVANESERSYHLWLPSSSSDTYAKHCYVFHTFLEQWTHWNKPAACGIALERDYKLYLSSGLENVVLRQRKNGDNTDYSDEAQSVVISGQSGNVVTASWGNFNFTPVAGMTLHQSSNVSKITNVKLVAGNVYQFTLADNDTYTNASATVRMPIQAHVRLSPDLCGESGALKQFYTASYILESESISQASIEVGTNEAASMPVFQISRTSTGTNPSRSIPWQVDMPISDTTGEAVTSGWYHGVSQEQFVINQVSYSYDNLAELETTP